MLLAIYLQSCSSPQQRSQEGAPVSSLCVACLWSLWRRLQHGHHLTAAALLVHGLCSLAELTAAAPRSISASTHSSSTYQRIVSFADEAAHFKKHQKHQGKTGQVRKLCVRQTIWKRCNGYLVLSKQQHHMARTCMEALEPSVPSRA